MEWEQSDTGKEERAWNSCARQWDVPVSLELVIKRQLRARRDQFGGEKSNPELPIHRPLQERDASSYSKLNSSFAFPKLINP